MKMNFLLTSIKNCSFFMDKIISEIFNSTRRNGPELCYAFNQNARDVSSFTKYGKTVSALSDIINDGFLWAVPKHRRSLERRMTRRMGFGKLLLPKKNIIVCEACGHFHQRHTVCGNCYEKIKEETNLMKAAIVKELKLDPIEQEIVVLYENDSKDDTMFSGKRIVELPKERPQWFSRNLLAKDTEVPRQKIKSISSAISPPTVTDTDK